MKKIVFFLILTMIIGTSSCNNGIIFEDDISLSDTTNLPGTSIADMVIDNNHAFYFITSEMDTEAYAKLPLCSNYIPFKSYLSKKTEETGNIEILIDRYGGGKLYFDKNHNQLLSFTSQAIYKFDGKSFNKIIEFPDLTGTVDFIAVDKNNNIWAGGSQTGLYKIDAKLNITRYLVNNSKLPTNSLTAIHIDESNNIWIALWDNHGILKITNDQWIIFSLNNSDITPQNIWCLVTDEKGNLWAGSGWDNENQSLIRFNGERWEIVNPRNEKNEIVTGTVRHLQSDGHKLYVVSEKVKNLAFYSNELLTFDGVKWDKVHDIPDDEPIGDLIVDNYRQAVWIWTINNGIYKKPF